MRNLSVLIVDDDDLIRSCMKVMFERVFGWKEIVVSESGELALRELENSNFDLLFTDRTMPPGMNGEELIRKAKLIRPGIKTIMMTGDPEVFGADVYGNDSVEIDVGADVVIKKPAQIFEIENGVCRLFPPR